MKITRRQLRRIIEEAVDRFDRDAYIRQLRKNDPRGEVRLPPFMIADKYRSERDGPEMRKKGFSDGFNGEFPQEEDDDDYMQGYEEGQEASDSGAIPHRRS